MEFFKTGLFSVGGGMATLPFLVRMGEDTGWFTSAELANMVAISESTPGPLGVNMATYVGEHTAGILGSLTATLALIAPCFIISVIISFFLEKFSRNPVVKTLFYFLRGAVIGLLCYALLNVLSLTVITDGRISPLSTSLFIGFFVLIHSFKKIHPVVWIVLGAVLGILLF